MVRLLAGAMLAGAALCGMAGRAGAVESAGAGGAGTGGAKDARIIIVTAFTPLGDRMARLSYPAQEADAEDIGKSHAIDMSDYLKRAMGGVFVNDVQGNPLQPDINYRGFAASPVLGTPQGLSVYMDGVRLNQPFGDVVSWDLIPHSAIAAISLVPGSNPLFGRNSLGGALSIRTKDGKGDPGTRMELSHGAFGRTILRAQTGGAGGGFDWFASVDHFREHGWRDDSPSRATQAFAKLGWGNRDTSLALSGSYARSDLNGNGLQEMRLLAADRRSVYTRPDIVRNRAGLIDLSVKHRFSDALRFSGTVFRRRIDGRTINGDVNEGALGGDPYQPTMAEQAALAAAGHGGFPTSGETQAGTPFPKWRCIADVLLDSVPDETCDGIVNRSHMRSREWGATGELTHETPAAGGMNRLILGAGLVRSRADFGQASQFGYLAPGRAVVPVDGPGAFADGTQASADAFDARVDMAGRTDSVSLYGTDALDLTPRLHVDLSARYDRTVIHNRDHVSPGGGPGSLDADRAYRRLNPAIALRWSASPRLAVNLALAQNSRVPSALELGCADPGNPCRLPNALAGDPPLRQVVARTVEAGLDGRFGPKAGWHLGLFRTVNRDDISFVADTVSGQGYFRNFGRTRRQGIEADFNATFGPARLHAHYSFLDATYRSAEILGGAANSAGNAVAPGFAGTIAVGKGDRIPLVPRHIFKAGADFDVTKRLSVNLDMVAQSGARARGNENGLHQPDGLYYLGPGRTGGYALFNAGADWNPVGGPGLFVQVDNLFDRHYSSAAQLGATAFDAAGNFVARPFGGPVIGGERPLSYSTFLSPGAPRSVQFGMRLHF